MKKNYKTIIQIIIGIIISVICLYFAFRGIDLKESIEIIKNVKIPYVIISLILSVVIIVFRALRWECFIPLKEPIKKKNYNRIRLYRLYGKQYFTRKTWRSR